MQVFSRADQRVTPDDAPVRLQDSMPNQFSPQRVRHSFKTKFRSARGTEKRDSNFCTTGGEVDNAHGAPCIFQTYRSSSTPNSSSSPRAFTYCAFPIAPAPFGPIS